jgi:glycosyltransferase involved in cell wall biosynthesis
MRYRILAYIDYLAPTGFSTVSHHVLSRLVPFLREHDIHVDVAGYNMGRIDKQEVNDRIYAYNPRIFDRANSSDPFYRDGFLKLLMTKPYDLVWVMNDVQVIAPIIQQLAKIKKFKKEQGKHPQFRTIFYMPVDAIPQNYWFKDFQFFDGIFTYTNYGKEIIEYALDQNNVFRKVAVVPHGIDTDTFHALPAKKQELRAKWGLPEDAYIFGTVNKNQPRKDIGTLLIAFAMLKHKNDPENKAVLYLHTHYDDPTGINIHAACNLLGLEFNKDYFLPDPPKFDEGLYTPQDLNELYNCMDVFVSTSMAEGWGLTVTEAVAVDLPVICGPHTSLKEIFTKSGFSGDQCYNHDIKLIKHFQIGGGNVIGYKLNPVDVADRMYYYLAGGLKPDPSFYQEIKDRYKWDEIAQKWAKIIAENLKIRMK